MFYTQALCYPILITSGNSYFPTTNYYFVKKTVFLKNQNITPISLFRLRTQLIKVYNYSNQYLYIAVEAIIIRPTCHLTRTEIWSVIDESIKQTKK